MRIEMRLCPNLDELDSVLPIITETKDNGIVIDDRVTDESFKTLIKKDYILLGNSFEERVDNLKKLKEGKIFFTPKAPMARFKLVED